MITNAANQKEQFEENLTKLSDFLTEKIKSEYRSDNSMILNSFYCFGDKSLMVMGENMSVSGKLSEDELEELLSFCQFLGLYGLESVQENLPIEEKTTMHLMKYTGGKCDECADVIKNENIYQFSQFSADNFRGVSFNTVYSYFARKVNRGVSDIYYLTEESKIISGALATRFDNAVYLTFVSTAKRHRNKGLAKKVIQHIISQNTHTDVILMCETELMPFYQKLGFEKTGESYLYKLRNEHI